MRAAGKGAPGKGSLGGMWLLAKTRDWVPGFLSPINLSPGPSQQRRDQEGLSPIQFGAGRRAHPWRAVSLGRRQELAILLGYR